MFPNLNADPDDPAARHTKNVEASIWDETHDLDPVPFSGDTIYLDGNMFALITFEF